MPTLYETIGAMDLCEARGAEAELKAELKRLEREPDADEQLYAETAMTVVRERLAELAPRCAFRSCDAPATVRVVLAYDHEQPDEALVCEQHKAELTAIKPE